MDPPLKKKTCPYFHVHRDSENMGLMEKTTGPRMVIAGLQELCQNGIFYAVTPLLVYSTSSSFALGTMLRNGDSVLNKRHGFFPSWTFRSGRTNKC